MPEEVLFKSESGQPREEIAVLLQRIVDNPENGDAAMLKAGNESVMPESSARLTFKVKAEREGPADRPGELSIKFELEWGEDGSDGGGGNDPLEIE